MQFPIAALSRRGLLRTGAAAACAPAFAVPATGAAANAAGDPFIGRPEARAAMTVWFDFQCPYCKLLWQETIPPLNDAYIRKGKLKLVFSDFSFLGKDSVTAAVVGRAVWHAFPQTYFAWTNAMFDAQDGENGGFGDVASVTKLTMALPGIDGEKLAKDFNANVGTYIAEVRDDFDAARRAGVRGTPAVMIGGKMTAPTLAEITARIDAVLAD